VRSVLCGCVLLVVSAPRADAAPRREGFWLGLGAGYGSARVDCEGCGASEREGGTAAFVKFGLTAGRHALAGVELNAWVKSEAGETIGLGDAVFALYLYPGTDSGFFLKGGAGLSLARDEVFDRDFDGVGWGVLAGIGYDLRIGGNVSRTPAANFYFGRPGELKEDGRTVVAGWKQNVVDVVLGITFH
jgi:hypothetical protein